MLGRLTKLAFRSAQLREAALQKEAALLGAVARGVGGAVAKHPGAALGAGLFGLTAGQAVAQKSKEFKKGFDPNSQQQMLGQPPTPPGA